MADVYSDSDVEFLATICFSNTRKLEAEGATQLNSGQTKKPKVLADTSQSEQAILVAEHADNVVAEQADSAIADQANNGHQMSEAQSTQLLLNMLDI